MWLTVDMMSWYSPMQDTHTHHTHTTLHTHTLAIWWENKKYGNSIQHTYILTSHMEESFEKVDITKSKI